MHYSAANGLQKSPRSSHNNIKQDRREPNVVTHSVSYTPLIHTGSVFKRPACPCMHTGAPSPPPPLRVCHDADSESEEENGRWCELKCHVLKRGLDPAKIYNLVLASAPTEDLICFRVRFLLSGLTTSSCSRRSSPRLNTL